MEGIHRDRAARALDGLEEVLNSIFMHTGAVFDQPDDFTNQQIDLNSTRMKEFMPKAIRRFEDHLVELDMQVTLAQRIFRRDLVLSRMKPDELARTSQPPNGTSGPARESATRSDALTQANDASNSVQIDSKTSKKDAGSPSSGAKPAALAIDTNATPPQGEEKNLDSAALDLLFDMGASPTQTSSAKDEPSPMKDTKTEDTKATDTKQAETQAQEAPATTAPESDAMNATDANNNSDNNNSSSNNNNNNNDTNHNPDLASLLPGLGDFVNDDAFPNTESFNEDMANPESFINLSMAQGDSSNFDQMNQDNFNFDGSAGELNLDDLLQFNPENSNSQSADQVFDEDFFNLG